MHSVNGGRPFFYQEVIAGGAVHASEYYHLGYVTGNSGLLFWFAISFFFPNLSITGNISFAEFNYGEQVKYAVNNFDNLRGVVHLDWGMAPTEHAFVFVDNHDNQRGGQLHFDVSFFKKRKIIILGWTVGYVRFFATFQFPF